eukprot:COSAG05_NODE_119_length_17779_cov_273.146049_20_plen_60_part_00
MGWHQSSQVHAPERPRDVEFTGEQFCGKLTTWSTAHRVLLFFFSFKRLLTGLCGSLWLR